MKKSMTREEKIVLHLYTKGQEAGDSSLEQSLEEIAKVLGLTSHSLLNSVNTLAKINFVKKVGKTHIRLSEQGLALAQELAQ